jgi:segregation and condensation protein B
VTREKKSTKKKKKKSEAPVESERPTLEDINVDGHVAADESADGSTEPVPSTENTDELAAAIASLEESPPPAEAEAPVEEALPVEAMDAEEPVPTEEEPTVETASEESEGGPIEEASDLSATHLRGLLEALVFASDKPMKTGELARMASAPARQVKEAMGELRAEYASRGIVLDEVAGGWLFRTNAQYAPFVRELAGGRPVKLTRAQIETLAIAAYRQPITRPEIDEIRGVDSGATLKLLLERDLIRILGKKDEPGRPLLYGTTNHFLEFFNMKSLKDLPTLREFTELSDESRRVAEAELGEVLPDAEAPHVPRYTAPAPDAGEDAPADEGVEETADEAPPPETADDAPAPEPGDDHFPETELSDDGG